VNFLDHLLLIGKPDQNEFQRKLKLNPEQALQILSEYTDNKTVIRTARRVRKDNAYSGGYEFLINPFQYVRETIQDTNKERLIDYARYLNGSEVWKYVSPHFYNGSAYTQVYGPMLDHCPKERKQELADILNARGALQDCFDIQHYTPEIVYKSWGIKL